MKPIKSTIIAICTFLISSHGIISVADVFTITAHDEQQLKVIWLDECPNGKNHDMFFQPYLEKDMIICNSPSVLNSTCLAFMAASQITDPKAKPFADTFEKMMTLDGTQYPYYDYVKQNGPITLPLPTFCPGDNNDASKVLTKLKNPRNVSVPN